MQFFFSRLCKPSAHIGICCLLWISKFLSHTHTATRPLHGSSMHVSLRRFRLIHQTIIYAIKTYLAVWLRLYPSLHFVFILINRNRNQWFQCTTLNCWSLMMQKRYLQERKNTMIDAQIYSFAFRTVMFKVRIECCGAFICVGSNNWICNRPVVKTSQIWRTFDQPKWQWQQQRNHIIYHSS